MVLYLIYIHQEWQPLYNFFIGYTVYRMVFDQVFDVQLHPRFSNKDRCYYGIYIYTLLGAVSLCANAPGGSAASPLAFEFRFSGP